MKIGSILVLAGVAGAFALSTPVLANARTFNSRAMSTTWAPETVSGTIDMIDPGQKLVVVRGPHKALFDMVVAPQTHIEAGGRTLSINALWQYQNKPVSVQFVPEVRGDVAESIRITG